MNLLNKVFNLDEREINIRNKHYLIVTVIFLLLILIASSIKIDYYYQNIYISKENNIMLLMDKINVEKIKNKNIIYLDDIKYSFVINEIINDKDIAYMSININELIKNKENGKYKILLGKETVFEYLIRIIKKE